MDDELRNALQDILIKTIAAFSGEDSQRLKGLSDEAIKNSAVHQDPYAINLAIIVYSLAKIVERRAVYRSHQWDEFYRMTLAFLEHAEYSLQNKKERQYAQYVQKVLHSIASLESYFRAFITEVLTQARIKRGSAIYERGLSVGRVAELMGISPWELMDYIGQRRVEDTSPLSTLSIDQRMRNVRRIFRV